MWNINSSSVQRAKDELQLRRTEFEARYAEEKQALDAEFAAIEALERAASEFMLRRARKNGGTAADGSGDDEGDRENAGGGSEPAAPLDPAERAAAEDGPEAVATQPMAETGAAAASTTGLDLLKPGSRWRLYRTGNRPGDGEGGGEPPAAAG
jgi:hypothetical protein